MDINDQRPRCLVRRTVLAFCGLPVLILAAGFIVGSPGYYSAKYSPAPVSISPAGLAGEVVPEVQTEPHTCGLHSLRSVYRAYGLDPDQHLLRFRLGTDKPVNNWLPETRGTIHPDMLRVLRQDGFDAEVLWPGCEDTAGRLASHLDAGHVAVVLIDAGSLHWVVASGREGDEMTICDSLAADPYRVDAASCLRDKVYSLLLVSPAGGR